MFNVLIENWQAVLISIASPVGAIYIILLLLSDKYDRLLFTPKKKLYYSLTRIISLSIIATMIASLLSIILTVLMTDNEFGLTIPYLIFIFLVYFISMSLVISYFESKNKTYYWVYLEKYQYEPLYIQKITFDNKLLMSSVPDLRNKYKEGFIIYEDVSSLENQKIFFLGPQNISLFRIIRPGQKELNLALEKYKPISNTEKVN